VPAELSIADPACARRIATAARVNATDIVVDVGAGTGILTWAALETGPVVAVELDRRVNAGSIHLRVRYRVDPNDHESLTRAANWLSDH